MVLVDKHLVAVGKYRGQDFFPRRATDGEAYFYQNFMCRALPGARRRIEELSANTKTGIFISHNMHHVFQSCDRVVAMARGEIVFNKPVAETSIDEVADYM